MDRIKLLTISVVILLLLNFGILSFLFLRGPRHPDHPPRPEPKKIIIEKLDLDSSQQKSYEKLILWHRSTIDSLDRHIRETKQVLYSRLLRPEVNNREKDSLIAILIIDQKHIEEAHFKHFLEVKKICRPEQMEDFADLTIELSRIFGHPPKPPHPPHD